MMATSETKTLPAMAKLFSAALSVRPCTAISTSSMHMCGIRRMGPTRCLHNAVRRPRIPTARMNARRMIHQTRPRQEEDGFSEERGVIARGRLLKQRRAGDVPDIIIILLGAGLAYGTLKLLDGLALANQTVYADAPPQPVEVQLGKRRSTKGLSKEENRDAISSQHLQVKRSWENPGVYAWGSNVGKVVAPDLDEAVIKTPRRIPYFDGVLLRDIKMDRTFGAAITAKGDLVQWGTGYDEEEPSPRITLKGKDLKSLAISKDRVLGLASDGKVFSIPASRADQEQGNKPSERSWLPFWFSTAPISYRHVEPKNLGWGEKVTKITAGLENLLLMTNAGRVFAAAACGDEFPARGEMGIPGLTWTSRPDGPYDQPHEISTLKGFEIADIASGDHHSLALDTEGRLFAFGDNTSGQLGFEVDSDSPYIDAPSLLPLARMYAGSGLSPKVTKVYAGGRNTFFTVDALPRASPLDPVRSSSSPAPGRVVADTWACGTGITGSLGNGRWTHIQTPPAKIKTLSGLFEYDEVKNQTIPIRLKSISVGSTHASATMDNVTHVATGTSSSADSRNDTNWGADVVWWGGNEHYQLGLGKRNNVNIPVYIAPLDLVAERERSNKRKEEHRFQSTPLQKVTVNTKDSGKKTVWMEQRVECGRMCSAVYSGV